MTSHSPPVLVVSETPEGNGHRNPIELSLRPASSHDADATSPTHDLFSYSREANDWLKRLHVHLKPLECAGVIERWDNTQIPPGARGRNEITQALAAGKGR